MNMRDVMRARVQMYGVPPIQIKESNSVHAVSSNTVRTRFKNSKSKGTVVRSRTR